MVFEIHPYKIYNKDFVLEIRTPAVETSLLSVSFEPWCIFY